jgi:hypothetical protein
MLCWKARILRNKCLGAYVVMNFQKRRVHCFALLSQEARYKARPVASLTLNRQNAASLLGKRLRYLWRISSTFSVRHAQSQRGK